MVPGQACQVLANAILLFDRMRTALFDTFKTVNFCSQILGGPLGRSFASRQLERTKDGGLAAIIYIDIEGNVVARIEYDKQQLAIRWMSFQRVTGCLHFENPPNKSPPGLCDLGGF